MPSPADIILISGPTASGKSALALRLAEATGAEIVNADALQLYRDLRVLSARPSPAEEARAPHHLFGIADAADGWSAGRWLRAARETLDGIAARERPAIVVGGTGLYFRVLTQGIAPAPAPPAALVAELEARFDRDGEAAVREALAAVDAVAAARIFPGDRQRLVRALAVARASGRSLTNWQATAEGGLAAGAWRALALEPPREHLYARCDARLATMVAEGAIEEAAALVARGLDAKLPAMKAVGLRELAAVASGEASLDGALEAARTATRRYAKRQLTWLRNQTADWPRVRAADAEEQWMDAVAILGRPQII